MADPDEVGERVITHEVLIDATEPIGFARVHVEIHFFRHLQQILNEIQDSRTHILLSHQVEAGEEVRETFMQSWDDSEVILGRIVWYILIRGVNDFRTNESRIFAFEFFQSLHVNAHDFLFVIFATIQVVNLKLSLRWIMQV